MKNNKFRWVRILGQMCWINKMYLLTIVLAGVSLGGIIILHLTSWRFFPDIYNKGACINYILETLSYSLFAASLFFIFNDMIPKIPIWAISRLNIQLNISKIRQSLRLIVEMTEPFRFLPKRYTRSEFTMIFASTDLQNGVRSLQDIIADQQTQIKDICENLIGSYLYCMTSAEIRYFEYVMTSFFIQNRLNPMNFSIPEESGIHYYNNQSEIDESIIDLYLHKLPKQYKLFVTSHL